MGSYLRPTLLADALSALARGAHTVLAGGTDFYPARVGRPVDEDLLDITAVAELRGVREAEGWLRIGATTTWSDVLDAPLPAWCRCLQEAAREIGGVQIQNAGTVAGNLCNASPAADGVPALLALGAEVELASTSGRRVLPLADFVLGNRSTERRPEELVTAVLVPMWGPGARSTFLKLGARRYLVISIAMVSAVVEPDASGRVARCGIAVGACSAVAQRLTVLEQSLVDVPLDATLSERVRPEHVAGLAPIDDVRGTGEYRAEAALTLVRRALEAVGGEAHAGGARS
jgi:CO/xanthine dehydrogenase FAD-binding subunit